MQKIQGFVASVALAALVVLPIVAIAPAAAAQEGDKPAAEGKADADPDAAKAEDGKSDAEKPAGEEKAPEGDAAPAGGDKPTDDGKEAPPVLPPPTDEATPAPAPAPVSQGLGSLSAAELQQLKAQIKEELASELKQQLQADLDAAARDAASQRAAALEWEEERWVEEVKPSLNFLEFNGYFRTRADLFNQLDLGTFDPTVGRGTSSAPPPTMYRPFDGDNCTVADGEEFGEFGGQLCRGEPEGTALLTSMNMRLRLDPTFHISEDIRIRSTVDVLDNLVLGSTPESKPGFANNPTLPLPLFASSQLPPEAGFNTVFEAIRMRRLWGEVMTPFGLLRFGRQATNWGLGILVNDGNDLDDDYGDSADQILFATRIAGHIVAPAYSISSVGAVGRGGGHGIGGDAGFQFYQAEQGQRFNLDPSDDVHTFILTVAKIDKEEDRKARLRAGDFVLNYGMFGVYRTQRFDQPSYYADLNPGSNPITNIDQYVTRDANVGVSSIWGRFEWDKLRLEAEAVGLFGLVNGTSTSSNGIDSVNTDLVTWDPTADNNDGAFVDNPLWIIQGAFAFESAYRFLNDSLEVGLDFGMATGDSAPGFGLRPVLKQNPQLGDADGLQYGQCQSHDDGPDGVPGNRDDRCLTVDNTVENYRFDPDYKVDLLLFREVMGTITDAGYIRPHVSYFVTEGFGVRGDLIYANALYEASTPGLQSPLGVEIDGSVFYQSDDGFFLRAQAGALVPLGGLSHARDPNDEAQGKLISGQRVNEQFLDAQWAYTLQAYAGIQF